MAAAVCGLGPLQVPLIGAGGSGNAPASPVSEDGKARETRRVVKFSCPICPTLNRVQKIALNVIGGGVVFAGGIDALFHTDPKEGNAYVLIGCVGLLGISLGYTACVRGYLYYKQREN